MSMHALGKHGIPKGVLTSPARSAIVAHLKAHGTSSAAALLEVLLRDGIVTADELARQPYWLNHHLSRLRERQHVVRSENDAGLFVWSIFDASAAEQPAEDMPSAASGCMAAPRHIDRMRGPVYQPPHAAPVRAGALDYAKAPSLMGSRRVPYRGGL